MDKYVSFSGSIVPDVPFELRRTSRPANPKCIPEISCGRLSGTGRLKLEALFRMI